MYENTYIQYKGGMLGQYGANEVLEPEVLLFDGNEEETIREIFGDRAARVYTIEE